MSFVVTIFVCFVRGNSSLFWGTAHPLPLSSLKQNHAHLEYTKEWKKGEIAPPYYVVFLPPPQGLPIWKFLTFLFLLLVRDFWESCSFLISAFILLLFFFLFFFFFFLGGGVFYHPSFLLNLLPLLIFSVFFFFFVRGWGVAKLYK